jgi:4-hydroxy-tetrahydrodipicolinate reductase
MNDHLVFSLWVAPIIKLSYTSWFNGGMTMIKAGLAGFGRAGRAVATLLLRSDEISLEWVLRRSGKLEHRSVAEFLGEDHDYGGAFHSVQHITAEELFEQHPVDVIVDFSAIESLYWYGEEAARKGVTIVSAISHYPPEVQELLQKLSLTTRVCWSPNITLGINYLMIVSKILQNMVPTLDFEIVEQHFKEKPGVSGTANRIADKLGLGDDSIKSVRAGGIVGRHEIICGFPYQTIRLIHESIGREAFGNGALFVIKNIMDKPAGFYTFEMLLRPYFEMP